MSTTLINNALPVFSYKPEDFKFVVSKGTYSESKFDIILKEKWKAAENNNVFRYKLNIKKWKILEGQYQFLAQLNIDRAVNRRQQDTAFSSMNQSFDPNKFNFTKLPEKEIYFDIENENGNNIIAVNVSPIEWGHCLFVPERFCNLPQRMTEHSLLKAVEFLLISSSPNLRIAFNSLCAFASVNHLHWHLYYLEYRLLLETIELQKFVGPVCIIENFPSKGFCIRLSLIPEHSVLKLVTITYSIIKYLQDNEIAHNVYITRAKCDPENSIFDDVRVYIWPRKPCYEIKDTCAFIPAVCELFGHLVIRSEEAYQNLTEESIANILNDITHEIFLSVRDDIQLLVNKVCTESK